ncbi:MAG TPA: hypothetical protein EYG94_02955 [Campylobacterales bacterium]|nr:hypothetical protein [Campylobacterales bacterium]
MRLKNLLLTMMLILLIFSFSGCSPKIKYIKSTCPKLVTFERDHNKSIYEKKLKLSLQRYDVEFFLIKEKDIKMLSKWFQMLKFRVRDDDEVLGFYEEIVEEYNNP